MLGFKTGKEAKKTGSWEEFSVSKMHYYNLWTRLRLALLILFGYKKIDELHIESKSNVEDVKEWVEQSRKDPKIREALRIAIEAFQEDED